MMCVGQEAERSAHIRAAELIRKLDNTFEALAQTAEAVARAEEDNAAIHEARRIFSRVRWSMPPAPAASQKPREPQLRRTGNTECHRMRSGR